MKKNNLLILLLLVFVGVNAQQTTYQTQKELDIEEKIVDQHQEQISTAARIYNIKYSLQEYETMIKRCNELTAKLLKHEELYKSGSMKKKQKKEWKRDLIEAKLLNFRIEDFKAIYLNGDYPIVEYINIQVRNNFEDFSKTLETSTQYAGF